MSYEEPAELIVKILNFISQLKEETFNGELVINFQDGEIEGIEQWEELEESPEDYWPSRCPENPRWN